MPKRLADTEIWNKDWFLNLNIKQKLLVKFIFDNCDCAGFYEISYRNLKNCFEEEIKKEDFLKIKQIKFITDTVIQIEDFIDFQYLSFNKPFLNPNNKAHLGAIKRFEKYNVDYSKYLSPLQAPSKPLGSPLQGVLDKDKDKEMDKENNISSSLLLSSSFKIPEKKEKSERKIITILRDEEKRKIEGIESG